MTHIGLSSPTIAKVPTAWLPLTGQITSLINTWANRDDLVAFLSDDPRQMSTPAFFNPKKLEIFVHSTVAFGATLPAHIKDLTVREYQFEFPKAAGIIYHEACHARFSTWDLGRAAVELTAKQNEALHLLEESRIEKMGIILHPDNVSFLRSSALGIVLNDVAKPSTQKETSTRQAIRLAALALARVDSGVLKSTDVKDIKSTIISVLGREVLRDLRDIWVAFQKITNPNLSTQLDSMYDLAKRWSEITDKSAEDEDKLDEEARKNLEQLMDNLRDVLEGAMQNTEIDAMSDVDDQRRKEHTEKKEKERAKEKAEESNNKAEARKVFSPQRETVKSDTSGSVYSSRESQSRIVKTREPSGEEVAASISLGKALRKAKYHDRVRVIGSHQAPPGRLKTRTVVQGAAYKSMNLRIETSPWQRIQRKHTIDPNLAVGIMTDVSGSMSRAMEPMGVTGWVLSEAVSRIQGTVAAVNFGFSVTPTIYPAQKIGKVNIYSVPDGSEEFDKGFQALDGALTLLNGSGARLLVVVSDGNFKGDQIDRTRYWLARCKKQGVAVLWVGFGSSDSAQRLCSEGGAQFVSPSNNPVEVANLIGAAALKALEAAGATR